MEDKQTEERWSAGRRQVSTRSSAVSSTSRSNARFRIAVGIFLAVALAYPWYSYWVGAYLLARDLEAVSEEFARISDEALSDAQKLATRSAEASRREQQRRRIASVQIKGVSDGPDGHVIIVDMGKASLLESDEAICRQASTWLNLDVSGLTLRVQRYRVNQPALDFGAVTCP